LPATDADYQIGRRRLMADAASLYEQLARIPGFFAYPTGANFVLVRVDNGMTAAELQRELLVEHRAYVRDCTNKAGLDDRHIRVASQGRSKDVCLVDALWAISRERSERGAGTR
jgi:histidinol-phosphate/aromatic aminotransferase/cobyric acid decarboxylase-like protein